MLTTIRRLLQAISVTAVVGACCTTWTGMPAAGQSRISTLRPQPILPPKRSATPIPTLPPVVLPIEVFGPAWTMATVQVNLPAQSAGSVTGLWLQVHGLSYPNKVSVQIDDQPWVDLNNSTVDIAEPGKSYGGIGGAFNTLKMTLPLPTGVARPGLNRIRFRFNGTDGVSMGFRVLGFDFVTADGTKQLPAGTFRSDDPATWKPPYSSASAIAMGQVLWRTAVLSASPLQRTRKIQARCSDCHAQDGRDLKYFNYSNNAIIQRSVFHGLSTVQGQYIASYIRSLKTPSPGRPWNPPYQPGPGLDSKPITDWAAGAGLDAVLDRDVDTLSYIFPNGISAAAVPTTGTLNVREIPIAMQLPDWNGWLPRIHPKDAWGLAFTSSPYFQNYAALRSSLQSSKWGVWPGLNTTMDSIQHWGLDRHNFLVPRTEPPGSIPWTPAYSEKIYSTALWQIVKTWEMMQEFNLEGYGPQRFGATGEARTWFVSHPFNMSPSMLQIPDSANGMRGSALTNVYLSNVWYHLQLILNAGNRRLGGNDPIDWGYTFGRLKDLNVVSHAPEGARLVMWIIKGMQESDDNRGPEDPSTGWNPERTADVGNMVYQSWVAGWRDFPAETRTQVAQALLENWFAKCQEYTPAEYYTGGLASPTEVPTGYIWSGLWSDRMAYMIPAFRAIGVDGILLNQICDWSKTIWPNANWAALKQ